ncbi:2,3,4,5-tetrahydropyridine-2,6-dicarboxylate N-succinyltransferase [Bernardetia sp. Wsw4-3y2]|uniref:2,3,4,5-tetrahydropyridine-2,6-dicarboxylate N-succinyltransferase n=1 Tax=Bernardetia sp. Wsw4-3y2 TaxID=3127471 RepID=UPI0030D2D342
MNERIKLIEAAWLDRTLLKNTVVQEAVFQTIEDLDKGVLRVAEPNLNLTIEPTEFADQQIASEWTVHEWIKKAVILYFPLRKMETIECPPFEFHDKIPLKKNYADLGVRVVPHAIARHGAFINRDVVMMPSYVNIGAYVDSGTMVDTWATVGSCAQIGKHVHLSGGVGIGGVLEPVQAAPVIIEDGAFIGSRCILVEGVRVGKEAVLGANVTITGSSKIIDVTKQEAVTYRGYVPPRSVVIPGSYLKKFPAGKYNVPCALIIGQRSESTDLKTSLNEALRQNDVAV